MKDSTELYKIQNGEKTILINDFFINKINFLNFDEDDIDIKILEHFSRPSLNEGIVKQLHNLGVKLEENNSKAILKEIKSRYEKIIGGDFPKTIREWIINGTPPSTVNKKNNFNLCILLEMNIEELSQFFLKYFLTIPFNFKSRIDSIYYYGIKNKKSYSEIAHLIELSKDYNLQDNSNTKTEEILQNNSYFKNDEEFLKYLKYHCYSSEQMFHTARNIIAENIKYLKETLPINSNVGICENITGYKYKETPKKSRKELCKEYLRCFPTDQTLADIVEGKKESYLTLRKTLIILYFYRYYTDFFNNCINKEIDINSKIMKSVFYDFEADLNSILNKCGLSSLYFRNPFDQIIHICALTEDPILSFHQFNTCCINE